MPQNTHLELSREAERLREPERKASDFRVVKDKAEQLASDLVWLPSVTSSPALQKRSRALRSSLKPVLAALESPAPEPPLSDDFRWLYDNARLLYGEVRSTPEGLKLSLIHI